MARARLLRGLLCAAAAQGAFGLPPRAQRGVDPVFRAVTEAAAAVRGATAAPRLGGGPTAAADAGARRPSVPTCFVAPLYVEHPSGATPGSFAYSLPLKATRTESIQASPPLASKLNMSSNTTNFLLGAEQLQVTGGLDPVCRKWSSHESFQDLFSWAADPLRSSFGGFETVGGRRCALWRLRRLAGANLSLCADGDTPVQLTTSYYGGAYKYTMTFGSLSAVGPEVDPRLFQAPPACRALAPACAGARGAGPVAIDAYVFHPGMSAIDYDIADQDVADLAGDVDFICSDVLNPDRNGSFVDHNYTRISRYSLLVSPAFGQYALCNGYPDTDPAGPLCFGGDSRLVGREAPFFFGEGESRCAAGSRIGFWYSLPRAGRCDPGEKPSQDAWRSGCTWASLRRLKTIDQDCLLKQQKLPERCMADIREGLGLHRSSGTLELAFASDDLVKGGCPDIGGPPGEAFRSADSASVRPEAPLVV